MVLVNPGEEEVINAQHVRVRSRESGNTNHSKSHNACTSAIPYLKPKEALQLPMLIPHTKPCKSPPRHIPKHIHTKSQSVLYLPPKSCSVRSCSYIRL